MSSMQQVAYKYETLRFELKSSATFLAIKCSQRTKIQKVMKLESGPKKLWAKYGSIGVKLLKVSTLWYSPFLSLSPIASCTFHWFLTGFLSFCWLPDLASILHIPTDCLSIIWFLSVVSRSPNSHLHELALKRIGCYLKQTSDQGMVMNPSSNVLKIDAYLDAHFAGMYGHEDHTDPICTKSWTGFIITFAECSVFWK